ncbi:hypothetical protein CCHL11_06023 [Colletotrichum chlorophyti]|uniref:Uncharacterized protein n=1 Tax=Colletotrichum chlorophyti TaxID=708187 RepID=A0A1Q8RWY5_9PEZI|nr:hypothetical protein CCHL11_06023 [Colletotrichum chlorophyti]
MKRTGAKTHVRPGFYTQAPPWAISLLGGTSGRAVTNASPPSVPSPDLGTDRPPSASTNSEQSNGESPEPDHIVSGITQKPEVEEDEEDEQQKEEEAEEEDEEEDDEEDEEEEEEEEPEDLVERDTQETTSLGINTQSSMPGSKKSLAASARIQALQQNWESTSGSSGSSANKPQTANRGKVWLGGGTARDATALVGTRKRSLPESPVGEKPKQHQIDGGRQGVITNKSFLTAGAPTSDLDLLDAVATRRSMASTQEIPGFVPATKKRRTIESSDEDTGDDFAMDIDEDAIINVNETTDDVTTDDGEGEEPSSEPAPTPARGNSSKHKDGLEFTQDRDRPYLMWRGASGLESTCGAILPTNYQLHSDPEFPLICPVKHRNSKFNDNLDGTLSFVDYYKKEGSKYAHPIVVSQNPLKGGEPPIGEPVMRRIKPTTSAPTHHRGWVNVLVRRSLSTSPPPPMSMEAFNKLMEPDADGNNWEVSMIASAGADSLPYLTAHLSRGYKLPSERPDIKGLLKLPRRRHLPPSWLSKHKGVGNLAPLAVVALLVYITGDPAQNQCTVCHEASDPALNVLQPCMVLAAAAPGWLKEIINETCAACKWRSNFRREKNQCSFWWANSVSRVPSIQPASRKSVSRSTSVMARAAASYALPYSQKHGQGSQAEQAQPDALSQHAQQTPVPLPSYAPRPPQANQSTVVSALNSPPRRVTRHSLAALKAVAEPGTSSLKESVASNISGNVTPVEFLEMEDWEVAPGRVRDGRSETPTSKLSSSMRLNGASINSLTDVAFSNSYLTSNQTVSVSEDIAFNVIVIKPGDSYQWAAEADKLRICSLAAGKLKINMDDTDSFHLGPNGMFKLKPGAACSVENRLYIDAVVHITSVTY